MKKIGLFTIPALILFAIASCGGPTGTTTGTTTGTSTGTTTGTTLSSEKALIAFGIVTPAATGVITGTNITITVPFGTSVTALVATFTKTGKSVSVGGAAQTSGTTVNDFTSPVVYIVTAEDNTTQKYLVTVTVAPSTAKDITSFSFNSPAATATITGTNIDITVPYATSVSVLVASFATSGASVKIGLTEQISGVTTNDYTSPIVYTITAANGTTKTYLVTVTFALNTAKDITTFSFSSPAAMGVITGTNISVIVPFATSVTALVASFTTLGTSVKVGGAVQTNGTTPNNFSSPVTYTATAADGTTKNYIVTVTVALNPAKALTSFSMSAGVIWTARDTNRSWHSVASSTNGTKLVATVYGGQIYTSTDSGIHWTARDSARNWWSVASSSDGMKLVATVSGGQIYTSTDSGATWTAYNSSRSWRGVASSTNGTKLVATVNNGQIYTSTDSGVTWTARDTNRNWWSVASSSDGMKLVAIVTGGQIYTSTDSGVTWTARDTNRNWNGVASSSDGTKLVAVAGMGQIYTSTDSGETWTARESSRYWWRVASSPDGTKLVAIVNGGALYTSTNSGVSWTMRESSRYWWGVAMSSDVANLVAVVDTGNIYTSSAATGIIDEGAHTINVTLPTGTAKTALVFNFAKTGVSVKVGSTVQVSGVTANNFTSPVTYKVTAADGTTQNYVVTVNN